MLNREFSIPCFSLSEPKKKKSCNELQKSKSDEEESGENEQPAILSPVQKGSSQPQGRFLCLSPLQAAGLGQSPDMIHPDDWV